MNEFYVYEHWRPDTDVCFYVGKGKGRRAYRFGREGYHGRVLAKLAKLGLAAEVRIVAGGLPEDEAFALERERIAFWRNVSVRLANATDGGEGLSNPSPEVREKISSANRFVRQTTEHREKVRKAITGRKLSAEHKEKIRLAAKGQKQTAASREKMRQSHLGKKLSMEHRKNMSKSMKKYWARLKAGLVT